ncbi:MAG TPA: vWA domain-containing protein [Burkholderiales bacterium]|nr:vWA domain-containing protein [Burkholderiales bacterium]
MKVHALLAGLIDKDSRAFVAALTLLVVALVLPPIKLPRDVQTYLVFIDITQSMNVEDYDRKGTPTSRLAFAHLAVRRAIRDLPCGSRVGLGAFSDTRIMLLLAPIEVCSSYHDLLVTLDYVDGRMRWKNASEIAKGVSWSIRAAREIGDGAHVVFITDGQEAPPLRPGMHPAFADVKPGEIRGWIIGAGTEAPRPIPKTDRNGKVLGYWTAEDVVQRMEADGSKSTDPEHLSALHERYLKDIAAQVGFDYARLADERSVSESMRDPRYAHRQAVPTDVSWVPAMAALLLLIWRFRPEGPRLANLFARFGRTVRSVGTR